MKKMLNGIVMLVVAIVVMALYVMKAMPFDVWTTNVFQVTVNTFWAYFGWGISGIFALAGLGAIEEATR